MARSGSIQAIEEIPEKIRTVFVAAMDISPTDHVRMQAAWQKYTDNAVSKTINMPGSSSVEDVLDAYVLAWKLKCKGITVYRDRSRNEQVLNVGKTTSTTGTVPKKVREQAPENCPQCGGVLTRHEGCMSCQSCGYSKCSL